MKAPTWAVVIGIFMILFGSCSINSSVQSINAPDMIEMQQEMMKNMSKGFTNTPIDSLDLTSLDSLRETNGEANQRLEAMNETMGKFFYMSDHTKKWTVRFGYIGIAVSLLYILGGVFLFIIKPYSLKLAFTGLILSIIFGISQMMVLTSEPSSGFIALASGYSKIFGVVIDIVFLIIVATADKTPYMLTKEVN